MGSETRQRCTTVAGVDADSGHAQWRIPLGKSRGLLLVRLDSLHHGGDDFHDASGRTAVPWSPLLQPLDAAVRPPGALLRPSGSLIASLRHIIFKP